MTPVGTPVAIVGAGWSGLACAIELARHGIAATLLDAAPAPGGRARRVELALGDATFPLDNGQHLLLGAYSATLATIEAVGLVPGKLFETTPFELRYPDGFALVATRAPAPWHLAAALGGARGLSAAERAAMVGWVLRQRARRWRLDADCPASSLFAGHPSRCVERIWNPLCLAALNVPLATASARIFLAVLRDSLGAASAASRFLLPRHDLSALLPDAAAGFLARHGATLRWRTLVRGLEAGSDDWSLQLRDGELRARAVVLALPPERAGPLLASAGRPALEPATAALARIGSAPIATIYLRYPSQRRLARPMLALDARPDRGWHAQFVFDRGATDPRLAGVFAAVVSGAGAYEQITHAALATAVANQLDAALALGDPLGHAVVIERRATIAPVPGLVRPPVELPVPGLYLAGDAADSPYPSTIEGSVRSGLAAARAILSRVA